MNWIESDYILGRKQWLLDAGLFILRVQDNGEGRFNWMASVTTGDDRFFSERGCVAEGTSPDPKESRLAAIDALGKLIDEALGIMYNATSEEA